MIQVKGTKTAPVPGNLADKYRLKDDEKSSTPFAIGLIVMALVAYAKSALWSEAGSAPAEPPDVAREPEKEDPVEREVSEEKAEEKDDKFEVPEDVAAGGPTDFSAASRSNVIDLAAYRPIILRDEPLDIWMAGTRSALDPSPPAGAIGATPGSAGAGSAGAGGGGGLGGANAGGSGGGAAPPEPADRDPSFPPWTPDGGDGAHPSPDDDDDDDDDEDDPETPTPNRVPRIAGQVTLANMVACATITIGMSDLLYGAYDPDGDPLSVLDVTASSGVLVRTADGWMFDPSSLGPVIISYRITDGQYSVMQTARFEVIPAPPIVGTAGDDHLLGTMCGEEISGLAGNDLISARGGADVVDGGAGDDSINGGDGDDRLFGGDGDDVIFAGLGNDHLFGGAGNDRLFGEAGDDIIFGEAGDDLIMGGDGNDLLVGGDGHDTIYGDSGDDTIEAGSGNDLARGGEGDDRIIAAAGDDVIDGGAGNDVIADGEGADCVQGGAGDDQILAAADGANDIYDGGSGSDTLNYGAAIRTIKVNLEQGVAKGADIGRDHVTGIETVESGSGDDLLRGSGAAETLTGNAGDDGIDAGAGDDVVSGGAGNDVIAAGSGSDHVSDGLGCDLVDAGAGDDTVQAAVDGADDCYAGGEGHDILDYTADSAGIAFDLHEGTAKGAATGNDTVSGFEEVQAGSGNDMMAGTGAAEVFVGNDGDDTILAGGGDDVVHGAAGNDAISDGAGMDIVDGGSGDDLVAAAADGDDDVFAGNAGNDRIDYSASQETIVADLNEGTASGADIGQDLVAGFEELVTGSGDDFVYESAGADAIWLGGGDDVLHASADGAGDAFHGEAGYDTLDYSASRLDLVIDLVVGVVNGAGVGPDVVFGFEEVISGSGSDHIVIGATNVVVTGGSGNDIFEYTAPTGSELLMHQILDFRAGDRVRMSKYDIFEEVFDKVEDQFAKIYGDRVDEDDARIRYRVEETGDVDRTIVEADMNHDGVHEISIQLHGNHVLVMVEAA